MALAFEIPFLDARNKHTTSGNKNKTIKPSYLNCVKMLADAAIILETSSGEVFSNVRWEGSGYICAKMRNKPITITAKQDESNNVFFLLDKSDTAIMRIVIGKNPIDNGCEKSARIKEIEEKGQLLKIKQIESR